MSLSFHECRARLTQRHHSHWLDGSLLVLREESALQADWDGGRETYRRGGRRKRKDVGRKRIKVEGERRKVEGRGGGDKEEMKEPKWKGERIGGRRRETSA